MIKLTEFCHLGQVTMTSLVILVASLLVLVHICPLHLDALPFQESDEASGEDKSDHHPVSTSGMEVFHFQEKRTAEEDLDDERREQEAMESEMEAEENAMESEMEAEGEVVPGHERARIGKTRRGHGRGRGQGRGRGPGRTKPGVLGGRVQKQRRGGGGGPRRPGRVQRVGGGGAGSNKNAFDDDINGCLFSSWMTGRNAVLSRNVQCNGKKQVKLCYGLNPKNNAQFAVCYNEGTLTPDFTGNLVSHLSHGGAGRSSSFRTDRGPYAPNPQSSGSDYAVKKQSTLYPNFNSAVHYLARGHLTPNADFSTKAERDLTFVTTNIAPQWQPFNAGNWARLESAVREYAQKLKRDVYVFTGVAGTKNILLNNRVQTPLYYWKAVCDPQIKQSILFYAKNPVGVVRKTKAIGCNRIAQRVSWGVIQCKSISRPLKGFAVPNFSAKNCRPSKQGLSRLTSILKLKLIHN